MADVAVKPALVFTVGPTNTSRCIQGSDPIRSENGCKAAAVAMGLPFEDVTEAGPSGCHMIEDAVFFNPLDQGVNHMSRHRCWPLTQHAECALVECSTKHTTPSMQHETCSMEHAHKYLRACGSTAACNIGASHPFSSPICAVRPNLGRTTTRPPGAAGAPYASRPNDSSGVRDGRRSKPTAQTPPSLEVPSVLFAETPAFAAARKLRFWSPATPIPATRAPGEVAPAVEEFTYDPTSSLSFDEWLKPLLNKLWAVVENLPPTKQHWLPHRSVMPATYTSTSRYDAATTTAAQASP
jgi:hypothetical protein